MTRPKIRKVCAFHIAGIAAASLVLGACSSKSDSGSATASDASTSSTSTAGKSGALTVKTGDCTDPAAATARVSGKWTIGWSVPLSGPVAGVVKPALDGWKARIAKANTDNELNGVKLEVKYLDDAFSPDRAKANFTEFIQKDKVNSLLVTGSGNTAAVADDQNAACVPLLYATSSDSKFRNIKDYPWTIQYSPSADNEAKYDIAVIKSKFPNGAKVGIAENQTETGKAFTEAFKTAAKGTNITVRLVTPSTDPNAAATALKAANPDVVYYAAVPSDCGPMTVALGRIGFKPRLTVAPSPCQDTTGWIAAGQAADGVIVPTWLKNPASPALAGDPDVVAYKSAVPRDEVNNPQVATGYLLADLTIATIKHAQQASNGLSRASVMAAARDLDYQAAMTITGIKWVSTPTEMLGFNGFQTQVWNAAQQTFAREGTVVPIHT